MYFHNVTGSQASRKRKQNINLPENLCRTSDFLFPGIKPLPKHEIWFVRMPTAWVVQKNTFSFLFLRLLPPLLEHMEGSISMTAAIVWLNVCARKGQKKPWHLTFLLGPWGKSNKISRTTSNRTTLKHRIEICLVCWLTISLSKNCTKSCPKTITRFSGHMTNQLSFTTCLTTTRRTLWWKNTAGT